MSQQAINAIDRAKIETLIREARASNRKRSHLLLHSGHNDQVQRLLIALQPGTYVRPHRHSQQWEVLILLQGQGQLQRFSDAGQVLERIEMTPQTPIVQIPMGTWHGFVVTQTDTVVMEIKPGPYRANEFADWAPDEQDPLVVDYLERLATEEPGHA